MKIAMLYEAILIMAALGLAAGFRKYFLHVYRTGHDNIGKSFGFGVGGLLAIWLFFFAMTLFTWLVPARALGLLLIPVLLASFTAGSALVAGLAGIDGVKYTYPAILSAGLASMGAEYFFPSGGRIIYSVIFIYGLGACLLALQRPLEQPAPPAAAPETEQAAAAAPEERQEN